MGTSLEAACPLGGGSTPTPGDRPSPSIGADAGASASVATICVWRSPEECTKDAAECFGAMGVMRDMPLQKYIGDALIFMHSGDGNSDAKLRIAEALVGFTRAPGHA